MKRDLVVIGASAGGVEALKAAVASVPRDLDAAILVVLHVPAHADSVQPRILTRFGTLPARHAADREELRPGQILIAPPDRHLVLARDHLETTRGPRENGHRPSVDVLFRSAARWSGPRVISVVLSGVLDDGTSGALAVRQRGGVSIAQDPADALYPGMPESAITHGAVDHVVPAARLGPLLRRLTEEEVGDADPPVPEQLNIETALARLEARAMHDLDRPGSPSGFSCPDCGGTLFKIEEHEIVRFRCRVGHAWSPESLLGQQSDQLDSALWMALRSLEEKAALAAELCERAAERNSLILARRYQEKSEEATRAANTIRELLKAPQDETA
jgi:two-component system chemotaxis response regulator CheB